MIAFHTLTKTFRQDGVSKTICDRVSLALPGGVSIGLLGRNGSGKSTLLQMIAGTVRPTSGRIVADGSVSFPVGSAGAFHPDLSGAQNARFVARLYGVDPEALIAFSRSVAEMGDQFTLPIRTWSAGMRSRLAFGLSMGLRFDTYLIDEVTAAGDAGFKRRSRALLAERLQHSGALVVSHAMPLLRELCTAGLVLEGGRLTWHDDIASAIDEHERNLAVAGEGRPRRRARLREPV